MLKCLHLWIKQRKEVFVSIGVVIGFFVAYFEYTNIRKDSRIKYTFELLNRNSESFNKKYSLTYDYSKRMVEYFGECGAQNKNKYCETLKDDKFKVSYGMAAFEDLTSSNSNIYKEIYFDKNSKEDVYNSIVEVGSYYDNLSYCVTSNSCSLSYVCNTVGVSIFNYFSNFHGFEISHRDHFHEMFMPNIREFLSSCDLTVSYIKKIPIHPREIYLK